MNDGKREILTKRVEDEEEGQSYQNFALATKLRQKLTFETELRQNNVYVINVIL